MFLTAPPPPRKQKIEHYMVCFSTIFSVSFSVLCSIGLYCTCTVLLHYLELEFLGRGNNFALNCKLLGRHGNDIFLILTEVLGLALSEGLGQCKSLHRSTHRIESSRYVCSSATIRPVCASTPCDLESQSKHTLVRSNSLPSPTYPLQL